MRIVLSSLAFLAMASCYGGTDGTSENQVNRQSPAIDVQGRSLPAEAAELPEAAPVEPISGEPPNDPALAGLSPGRRREYDRGYRDCARGQYEFNAEEQGEYYRIGCMTAENAKAAGR